MLKKLKVKCGWCHRIINTEGNAENSHDICSECKKEQLRLLEEMVNEQARNIQKKYKA